MRVAGLHSFQLSPGAARQLQGELAPRVTAGPPLDLSRVRCVAGADVSTQGDRGYAAVAVLSFPELSVVEVRGFEAPLSFPYVPGLLSFREIPPLVGALEQVKSEVDVVIFDAQGLAHPRGLGLASHLGLFLDVPAVGCAKSRLVGEHDEPGPEKGSATDLVYRKKVVGKVLRTRNSVSPVYVSVGNRIDLMSAVELVLRCCTRYRLPETTRRAHTLGEVLGHLAPFLSDCPRKRGRSAERFVQLPVRATAGRGSGRAGMARAVCLASGSGETVFLEERTIYYRFRARWETSRVALRAFGRQSAIEALQFFRRVDG